jgi:hypothetical protein
MAKHVHLIVERGPVKGREITVPVEGVRIGRSSRNDISIDDAALSRFHCRLFFKPGEGLWLSDLGSANGTLVNGREVQEQRVRAGDEIVLGETMLRVVFDLDSEPASSPDAAIPPAGRDGPGTGVPAVDLGLSKSGTEKAAIPASRRRLLWLALGMLLVVLLAWLPQFIEKVKAYTAPPAPPPVQAELLDIEISFERVEASSSNIFRYVLEVAGGRLKVQVDDLLRDRHVRREKAVAPELIGDLGRAIEATGFFDLSEDYSGMAPGVHETTDITMTFGVRTHRIKVLNHIEPEGLVNVRNAIEEFGKNELGLAALAIEPTELVDRARQALMLGQKLYDEREVSHGNLYAAIRAFTESEWYLETIEPKPDFYGEVLSRKNDCERDLQRRYDDVWFMAERAIKLRDWKEAARYLRVVSESIPDRSDDRNRNAYKKLVDVERHLATEK